MSAILLIDDNEVYCQQIQKTLALRGYQLEYETDPYKALDLALNREWDVILLDIVFYQDLEGLEILEKIKKARPNLPVIMVTAASTLQSAMEAVQKGAFDYLEKPINVERMTMSIKHAFTQKKLSELNQNLFNEFYRSVATNALSNSVREILNVIRELNEPAERILLFGEKGTGKELLAKVLHFKSNRKYGPFVSFYCNPQDADQEDRLFGVSDRTDKSGSPTGSVIRQADRGTLFIGEISNLSLRGQQRLAQFVHDNYYMPSFGKEAPALNIRLIVSTSVDLKEKVADGSFSEELFNLLNTYRFHLPPLRERPEDIPLLAEHFLREMNIQFGDAQSIFETEALRKLQSYSWPGNISELKSVIWLLSFFYQHGTIDGKLVDSTLQFYALMKDVKTRKPWQALVEQFQTFYKIQTNSEFEKRESVSN